MLEKEETDRSDLSLMARSLSTILKKRAPAWIDDEGKKSVESGAPSEGATTSASAATPAASAPSSAGAGEF
jgi:hypothetical protein